MARFSNRNRYQRRSVYRKLRYAPFRSKVKRKKRKYRTAKRNVRRKLNFGGVQSMKRALSRVIPGIPKVPHLIPKTKRVKLKWAQMITFNNIVPDSITNHQFRANGPRDPNVVVDGLQISPFGWNEYETQYGQHLCLGSTIRMTEINMGQTNDDASSRYYLDISLQGPLNEDIVVDHLENLITQNRISMSGVKQRQGGRGKGGPNEFRPIKLYKSWKLKKNHVNNYNKDILVITTGTTPAGGVQPTFMYEFHQDNRDTYSSISRIADIDDADVDVPITFMVEIVYDILFSDPKYSETGPYNAE